MEMPWLSLQGCTMAGGGSRAEKKSLLALCKPRSTAALSEPGLNGSTGDPDPALSGKQQASVTSWCYYWSWALLLLQRFRGYGEEIILRKSNLKQCLSTNGARLCNGCVPVAACSSARLRFRTKKEILPPADQGRKEAGGVSSFSRVTKKPFSPGPVPGKGKRLPGRDETQNDHAATITGKATYKSWQKKKRILIIRCFCRYSCAQEDVRNEIYTLKHIRNALLVCFFKA